MLFNIFAVASLALAASARVVPRQHPPQGWAYGYLEKYAVYHTRYLALDCESQHGRPFFDKCCHPMLATETLAANRAPECVPSSPAYSSAMSAESSAANGGDCSSDVPSTTLPSHTSSSSYHAPPSSTSTPSSSYTPPPHTSTTSTPKPHTSTSSTAMPASSNLVGSLGSLITGGVATFFYQNGNAGACGQFHSDYDLIAAIDQQRYGNSGSASSLCGKQVKITNTLNGKTVVVTIEDDCPTCINKNSIDLSVGAFTQIATEAQGEVAIEWQFLN